MNDDELADLVRVARDEDDALGAPEGCVGRLRAARTAQTVLANLPAEQLRAVLTGRRTDLGGEPA